MIATLLVFGFLAGLDNLQVCSSLGLLPMTRVRRNLLAAAFGVCETAAPLAGLAAGRFALTFAGQFARIAGPAMMIGCGLVVVAAALRAENEETSTRMLFGLPLSLSLDNIVAGFGISPIQCPVWIAALTIGGVSAAMSCMGLYGAARVRTRIARVLPARPELAVGGYLCVVAARSLLKGG